MFIVAPTGAINIGYANFGKFDFKRLLRETGIPSDVESEADLDDTSSNRISTDIARVNKLSELVAGLPCPLCRCKTIAVHAVNCALGLVCQLQTYYMLCDNIINSTYSSNRISGTAGHLPFVVTGAVVSALLDMGVGYNGIVTPCRYLDMNALNHA